MELDTGLYTALRPQEVAPGSGGVSSEREPRCYRIQQRRQCRGVLQLAHVEGVLSALRRKAPCHSIIQADAGAWLAAKRRRWRSGQDLADDFVEWSWHGVWCPSVLV
jgi:hypothetical protein